MQTKINLIFAVMCVFLYACGGQQCFKIGGEYKGVDGSFEYCFNAPQSKQAGLPVLDGKDGSVVAVPASDLNAILSEAEKIQPKPDGAGVMSIEMVKSNPASLSERIQAVLARVNGLK